MAVVVVVDFRSSFIFILLSILSFLCLIVFFFKKPKDSRVRLDLPPSPPSLPLIGHLHLLLSDMPHKAFQKLSSKYGSLMSLRVFTVPIVVVSSPSMAYEIFTVHDEKVSYHGHCALDESLLFGSSGLVLAPYGDYWKYMKKLIMTKVFGSQALKQLRRLREDELKRFYENLLEKAMKNETVYIHKEAIKLNSNNISKTIMGKSCSEENGETERARGLVSESFAVLNKLFVAQTLRKPLEKFGISLFKKEILRVSSKFDEFLERFLVEHEDKMAEDEEHQGKDMMDTMLEAYRDENAEYKITRKNIKSLFVDLILAGTDTSAQSTQWTMAEIINNPSVFERLREEIDLVIGKTRLIQETDLPNLPYLQAVVKESLRLHPPGPLVARKFIGGCEMRGFYVPKNAILVVNGYAVMRDPDVWEDPEEFKPERFLASSKLEPEGEREKALKYIPFGSGRRGCPGSSLAYIFIGTAVGIMVQGFDWKIKGDKVNMEEVGGMVLSMAYPLACTLVARTHLNVANMHVPSPQSS